jgi:hypothetical protein
LGEGTSVENQAVFGKKANSIAVFGGISLSTYLVYRILES